MKVLLANPKSSNAFETFGFVFPPLGLLYVAATTEQAGHHVVLEDFSVSGSRPSRFDFRGFDIVGITTDTRRFSNALAIAKRAKAQGRTVVMGGPHPGYAAEEILKGGYADFVVRGEGEYTFPSLLKALEEGSDAAAVPGLSYYHNGGLVQTPDRALIEDLDELPFPARHLADMDRYKEAGLRYGGQRPVAVISSSRGCPHTCSFCITPNMYGRRWRARSADSVVAEIEEVYHRYGYRAVAFCDDNFTVSPRRVLEICSMLLERKLDLWWWCLSSVNTLLSNEEMIEQMARAGARTVYIGVESANPSTLKEFKKNIAQDGPFKAVDLLRRHGVEAFASFILGGIDEDVRSVRQTIRLARELDTAVAQFTILTPYPGTALFKELSSSLRHRKWRLYDGVHLVFRHRKVPYVVMELLLIWAYVSFYSRGWTAVRKFFRALTKNSPLFKKFIYAKDGKRAIRSSETEAQRKDL